MTDIFELLREPTIQTLQMVFFSTIFSLVLGAPLGILLNITDKNGILKAPALNLIIGGLVNACRSFPFIILMIVVFPLSRLILGTSIGTAATIVPLSIAASPFVARIIEGALKEVDPGVIESARSMGSSRWQIVSKVLIPEAMPSIINGITLTVVNLIGYSAMAGAIGGGGIGDLAIRDGYQRNNTPTLIISVIALLVLVQFVQLIGNYISNKLLSRR